MITRLEAFPSAQFELLNRITAVCSKRPSFSGPLLTYWICHCDPRKLHSRLSQPGKLEIRHRSRDLSVPQSNTYSSVAIFAVIGSSGVRVRGTLRGGALDYEAHGGHDRVVRTQHGRRGVTPRLLPNASDRHPCRNEHRNGLACVSATSRILCSHFSHLQV